MKKKYKVPFEEQPTKEQLDIRAGENVYLTDDLGKIHETKTRSNPWLLDSGSWVILVEGRSGGYDLCRIQKI